MLEAVRSVIIQIFIQIQPMNARQPNIIGNAEDFFAPPEDEDEHRNVSLFAHEIDARAKTPRQLHEVCQNAHFFMPCASSPVCNKHFLADVLCGKCYMPKNNEIRQKAVFGSPPDGRAAPVPHARAEVYRQS